MSMICKCGCGATKEAIMGHYMNTAKIDQETAEKIWDSAQQLFGDSPTGDKGL